MCCYGRLCSVMNIIISSIGTLIGISIFVACLFFYTNYNAAFWGLASGVFSACCLHLHRLHYQQKLSVWYTRRQLEKIQSFGLFFFLITVVLCGIYLSLAIVRHQGFSLKSDSFYPAAVACVLTMIWSLCLFLFSHCYQKRLMEEHPSLLSGAQILPDF